MAPDDIRVHLSMDQASDPGLGKDLARSIRDYLHSLRAPASQQAITIQRHLVSLADRGRDLAVSVIDLGRGLQQHGQSLLGAVSERLATGWQGIRDQLGLPDTHVSRASLREQGVDFLLIYGRDARLVRKAEFTVRSVLAKAASELHEDARFRHANVSQWAAAQMAGLEHLSREDQPRDLYLARLAVREDLVARDLRVLEMVQAEMHQDADYRIEHACEIAGLTRGQMSGLLRSQLSQDRPLARAVDPTGEIKELLLSLDYVDRVVEFTGQVAERLADMRRDQMADGAPDATATRKRP